VFLVEDNAGYRESLRFLLETAELRVEDFGSAPEFLARVDPGRPGCVVSDIRMPGMSGLELQEQLKRRNIRLPVIFITGHGTVRMSVQALQSGAVDFVEKPLDGEILVARILSAFEHDRVQRVRAKKIARVNALCERLTAREREVMDLIFEGQSNKQIALALDLSHRTVEVHRARIMAKMECRSLPDLLRFAAECGLLNQTTEETLTRE